MKKSAKSALICCFFGGINWRLRSESNRRGRLCRPFQTHLFNGLETTPLAVPHGGVFERCTTVVITGLKGTPHVANTALPSRPEGSSSSLTRQDNQRMLVAARRGSKREVELLVRSSPGARWLDTAEHPTPLRTLA